MREEVRKSYGKIAQNISGAGQGCCGGANSCCSSISKTSVIYNIDVLSGLPAEAIKASLGCANPLVFAELKEGETVLDLGSGGGIDVLAASKYVGDCGTVYGLDMTDEMLELANSNKEKMRVSNVHFLKGYIESIPLPDESVDVVMSNCVINLSDDKDKAIKEIYRVLKPQGRIAIADIISTREVESEIRKISSLWIGCIAGALSQKEYEDILKKANFKNITIKPEFYYTKEVLMDMAGEEVDYDTDFWSKADRVFAGALIKATK